MLFRGGSLSIDFFSPEPVFWRICQPERKLRALQLTGSEKSAAGQIHLTGGSSPFASSTTIFQSPIELAIESFDPIGGLWKAQTRFHAARTSSWFVIDLAGRWRWHTSQAGPGRTLSSGKVVPASGVAPLLALIWPDAYLYIRFRSPSVHWMADRPRARLTDGS